MNRTSQSLLDRLRRLDDEASWARFTALYTPLLYSWARRLVAQPDDAADLVQDVFTAVVRRLPEFHYDPSRSFRAWLRTILLNRWRTIRRQPAPASLAVEPAQEDPGPALLDEQDEADYRRYLLRQALGLLRSEFSTTFWRAFEEHVLADRPAEEVAARLGISPGTVYVAKSRIFKRLRQELAGLLD
jgi:RNA polymerase sigma-70 factor (ECF subfamily)